MVAMVTRGSIDFVLVIGTIVTIETVRNLPKGSKAGKYFPVLEPFFIPSLSVISYI